MPGKVTTVEIAIAAASQRATIANLLQLYLHDFSEFADVGTPHGEIGPDGRFRYNCLDSYWQDEDRFPFLILADGHLAGFCLVNRWSALNRPLDRAVAEFFVARKYRRAGVGARAAALVFAHCPGRWEVPVAAYNKPALAFWRTAITAALGHPPEEIAGDGNRWNGPVLRFDQPPC